MSGFNLRREAAPHATTRHSTITDSRFLFQSQTRSRSTCDAATSSQVKLVDTTFQSQTRSRSTCDYVVFLVESGGSHVSISDEKPLHMRPRKPGVSGHHQVVSISDEKPLHMRLTLMSTMHSPLLLFQSQTRSRSTCDFTHGCASLSISWFQSQT